MDNDQRPTSEHTDGQPALGPGGAALRGPSASLRFTRMLVVLGVLLAVLILPPLVKRIQYASEYGKQRARMDVALVGLKEMNLEGLSVASRWVAQVMEPSVVQIRTRRRVSDSGAADLRLVFPGQPRVYEAQGEGSGVIVDPEGFLVTNHHVIDGWTHIEVQLSDGRRASAHVVGADAHTDIAVLKIPVNDLAAAAWGDSDALQTGDMVWAVGSPFGLEQSVTFGIVSAKGRHGVGKHSQFQDLLQTDAAVNPGNSGGPLVNVRGEIIGINSAIAGSEYKGVSFYQGISFAVPSHIARDVYEQLKAKGRMTRAFLGVGLQDLTTEIATHLGIKSTEGALVASVHKNSPAAKGGLRPGDVVVAWNGAAVAHANGLSRLIAATGIGSGAQAEVIRDGRRMTLSVVVTERPQKL